MITINENDNILRQISAQLISMKINLSIMKFDEKKNSRIKRVNICWKNKKTINFNLHREKKLKQNNFCDVCTKFIKRVNKAKSFYNIS